MADNDDIQRLSDRLIEDEDLRARFIDDPVGVVNDAGIETTDDQEQRLADEDWAGKSEDEFIAQVRDTGLGFWF